MDNDKYTPVIGLEVHVELKTKSKMFCGCSSYYFGQKPNTYTCPICLGLPGALPVPNKKAIEWCVMVGLALNCEIPLFSKFDRKNYFYPDLPKGYQISQYDQPFAVNGYINIKSQIQNPKSQINSKLKIQNSKRVGIRRVHMEEDTAKLMHLSGTQNSKIKTQNFDKGYSLIDFNRSGVPLVEIVTEPDFESISEVTEYLKKLQQIVRYLGVSDADMEKGEMRLEPNISLLQCHPERSEGSRDSSQASRDQNDTPNYKVEVKNINSFKFVKKAINYEVKRQEAILRSGRIPIQETRGWNERSNRTDSQRSKEEAHDYRYFPEPDIPSIRFTQNQISNIKNQIGELPDEKLLRFMKDYKLSISDSQMITGELNIANYFEEAVKVNNELRIKNQESINPKAIVNWITNKKVNINTTLPAQLIQSILTSTRIKTVDTRLLEKIIQDVFEKNKKAINDYKNGKAEAIMFLVGQVMSAIKEKIDPIYVREKLKEMLQ